MTTQVRPSSAQPTSSSASAETSDSPGLRDAERARAPFAGGYDYLETLDRLTVKAAEAQDGRAVRFLQRFIEVPFRGFAALFPRPYDPGESPLAGGPLLDDAHWKDEVFDLLDRLISAANTPPAYADARWREQADLIVGAAWVLQSCFVDSAYALAVRQQAFATAWRSLDNAVEHHVRHQEALADFAWATYRVKNETDALNGISASDDVEPEVLSRVTSRLKRARRKQDRATRRVERAWSAVRMHTVRRHSIIPVATCRHQGRAPRLRTNHRTGGSRRSTPSRGDPDGDPPGHSCSVSPANRRAALPCLDRGAGS